MLELQASDFYAVTRGLRNLKAIVESAQNDAIIPDEKRPYLKKTVEDLMPHLEVLRANVTWTEADRILRNLTIPGLTYGNVRDHLHQLDMRLQDELLYRKIFVLDQGRNRFFESAILDFGDEFPARFTSALYEISESGKCLALDRSTASVFHLMRIMEIGVGAAARCLGIPDPIKPSERNWGNILKKIKDVKDEKTNKNAWTNSQDKEIFESVYVSLDAIRVAWRNPTMHVEKTYTVEEAEHIFITVRAFMKMLASRMDDQGLPAA